MLFLRKGRFSLSKGKIYLLIAAFLYGIAPMLAKVTYSGGANGITLSFLRTALSVPILFAIMKANKRSLKLTKRQLKSIIILGVFGGALPILLLYFSYNIISTGLSTTLHFVYPLIIVLASALLYHEKISKFKLLSVILVTLGIFMFADIEAASDSVGIVLALLSGVFYSFFVMYIDRSGLDSMDYIKLTFYLMIIMSIVTLSFGFIVHGLSFDLSGQAWSFAAVISLIVTLGAMPLFQLGVRYEGASTAGIMSTFEPITSVALGAVFLGEFVGVSQIFGIAMILSGIIVSHK